MAASTAVLAAGTGLQAYSKYQEGRQRAEAAKQEAKFKRAQAREMLERLALEEKNIQEEGEQVKAQQLSSFAASGVELGTGATLIALEDTNSRVAQRISNIRRDVNFRASQLKRGADFSMTEAGQFREAGTIGAAGSLLAGGASFAKNRSEG